MRELALLGSEIASVASKPVADFFVMELLVKILSKIDWELHEIPEVLLLSLALSYPFDSLF